MKRIYMTLVLLGTLSTSVLAQRNVDVKAFFKSPTSGATINCTDSFIADYAFINLGPDAILTTDTFAFSDFESTYNTDGTIDNIFLGVPTANANVGDTINIGGLLWKSHMTRVKTLVDTASLEFINGPFADGGYIAFNQFLGFGHIVSNSFVFDTTVVKDIQSNNNIDGHLITISCTSGIDEAVNGLAKQNLNIYPNPASNTIKFKATMANGSAVLRVSDISGRTVLVKDFGKQTIGEKELTLNVSALKNGMYYVEFVNGEKRSISKLSIQK
jgi:hypothetical protein